MRRPPGTINQPNLPPVTFDKHPTIVSMSPPRSYPACMSMRRRFPPARSPDVSISFPTVITADPHVRAAGPRTSMLHHYMWRMGPDHYLCRMGRTDHDAQTK